MPIITYIGPMYAGKTTLLLDMYKVHYNNNTHNNCLIVNHSFDNNIEEINNKEINKTNGTKFKEIYMMNHNKERIKCYTFSRISNIIEYIKITNNKKNINTIFINEFQFFEDIKNLLAIEKLMKQQYNTIIKIYLFGLNGDFKQEMFDPVTKIIPYCDEVHSLKAICNGCNKKNAIYSKRLTNNIKTNNNKTNNNIDTEKQILIGEEHYKPYCKDCFNKYN